MQFNLKTTINAFPKLSPNILNNYVTRDELKSEDYVKHAELSEILKSYVTEVENPDPSTIYGRKNGTWVPVVNVAEITRGVLCYGMVDSTELISDQLQTLTRFAYVDNVDEYLVEYQPKSNGYFWFACTTDILDVEANSGMLYKQDLIKSQDTAIEYMGKKLIFKCYRTPRLVALPGIPYKFRVRVALGE